MAQAGFTPISLYFSSTAAAVPTSGNLANGELALNIADMKLYAKNSAGAVTLLASSGGATGTVSSVAATVPPFLSIAGSPITTSGTLAISLSGSALPTTSGGTGLTSFTSGGVVYASSSSALATGSALTFDGTNLGLGGTTNTYGSQTTLTLSGSNVSRIDFRSNGVFTGTILSYQGITEGLRLQTEAGYPIVFSPAQTEAGRFTTAGNLGIGTSSPAARIEVFNSAVNGAFVPNTVSTWRVAQIRNDQTGTSGSAAGLAFVGTSSTQPAGIVAINSNTTGGIVSLGFLTVDGNTVQESFRFGPVGQLGIGGANYGTSGQVLTSGGSGAAPTWAAAGGGSQAFVAFGSTGESVFASQGF